MGDELVAAKIVGAGALTSGLIGDPASDSTEHPFALTLEFEDREALKQALRNGAVRFEWDIGEL